MTESMHCQPGDRVEAYRENTPNKIEWTGVVEHVRPRGHQYTVVVDNLVIRNGRLGMQGGPVRLAFSSKGIRLAPSYGPAMMSRKVEGSSPVRPE